MTLLHTSLSHTLLTLSKHSSACSPCQSLCASISLSKHSERLRHMSVTVCKHFSHLQSKKCYHGPSDWESHVKFGSELRLPNAGDDR